MYVLDHSSEVEASNCRDCQLFVGPVDGAAIFDSCSGCTVAVASQQFQARGCSDVDFGLYCATAPTVRSCKGVRVGCWVRRGNLAVFGFSLSHFFRGFSFFSRPQTRPLLPLPPLPKTNQVGAYTGLTRHFAAANLDPASNQWRKVHDATPAEEREEGEGGKSGRESSFEIVESSPSWWEVPIEGGGGGGGGSAAAPPDNPVPAADGALYSPPSVAASPADAVSPVPAAAAVEDDGGAAAAPAAAPAAAAVPAPFGSGLTPAPSAEIDPLVPLENGEGAGRFASAPTDNGGGAGEAAAATNLAAAQAARAARERLAKQEEAERAARAEAQARAADFLSDFYAKRDAAAAARPKPAAAAATPEGGGGPSGASPWERVLSMLDLDGGGAPGSARSSGAGGATPPNAADLSRFKAAMFTAKAKGLGL